MISISPLGFWLHPPNIAVSDLECSTLFCYHKKVLKTGLIFFVFVSRKSWKSENSRNVKKRCFLNIYLFPLSWPDFVFCLSHNKKSTLLFGWVCLFLVFAAPYTLFLSPFRELCFKNDLRNKSWYFGALSLKTFLQFTACFGNFALFEAGLLIVSDIFTYSLEAILEHFMCKMFGNNYSGCI